MKKFLSLMLALLSLVLLVACGDTSNDDPLTPGETEIVTDTDGNAVTDTDGNVVTKPTTVTIRSMNANKEYADLVVPYDPQRIAILDMPSLDIIDGLGLGDRVVGSAAVSIEYLTDYNPDDSDGKILNLGSIKTMDLEQVLLCDPDIIFIGGRLSSSYDTLSEIAPVVYLGVDYEKGVVQSTADNAKTIASIFGKEAEIDAMMAGFQTRINALKNVINGKNVLLCMFNNNSLSLMDTESQLNIIAKELGGVNLGENVGDFDKPTHGEDASWESIVNINPEYMFVLDRSTAIGSTTTDDGTPIVGAQTAIENALIKEMNVYKEGKIVYFVTHANVWYTSTGGIQALDTMLSDLETALIK